MQGACGRFGPKNTYQLRNELQKGSSTDDKTPMLKDKFHINV